MKTAHKDDWYEINGESNKWAQFINITGINGGMSWPPRRMTSINGDVFGLVAKLEMYSTLI